MKVAVVGASGYTGAELLRLCASHPQLDVVAATAGTQAGQPVASLYPSLSAAYPGMARTVQLHEQRLPVDWRPQASLAPVALTE